MDLHYTCPMENNGITIPAGTRKEDIKAREKIIKDFYAKWISEHPDKKIWNEVLQDYICVKYQSINKTYNKAARRYESTLAVLFDRSNGKGCLQRGETDKTCRQEPEALLQTSDSAI